MPIINISFFHRHVSLARAHWQSNNIHLNNIFFFLQYFWLHCSGKHFTEIPAYLSKLLTSVMVFHPLVLPLNIGSGRAKPALLMHTSMPWCWALIQANMDKISSSTDISHLYGCSVPVNPQLTHSVANFYKSEEKNLARLIEHHSLLCLLLSFVINLWMSYEYSFCHFSELTKYL